MTIALYHAADVAEAGQPKMEKRVLATRHASTLAAFKTCWISKPKTQQNEKANKKAQSEQKNDFKSAAVGDE